MRREDVPTTELDGWIEFSLVFCGEFCRKSVDEMGFAMDATMMI